MNSSNAPQMADAESSSKPPLRKSSCAECQRLKLKCDKNVPCASCVRRGAAGICPTGTLRSSGRGKRSVMSNVPQLTAVIAEMGDRIRQLEQAVARAYEEEHDHHPLLRRAPQHPSPSTPAQNAEVLGAFFVNEAGDAVYFGPTAGTEALLSIEGASAGSSSEHERVSFAAITESFPFSSDRTPSWDPEQALERLYAHLPLEERAWSLCATFYRNGCWTAIPIEQDDAADLLTLVYQHDWASGSSSKPPISLHQMAILYLIFALGSLVDLELEPYSLEADHYFDLGCAALSVTSLFENPSVTTVRVLMLVTMYYAHGGRRFSMDAAYSTVSLASGIAKSLGMHRASFGSKLTPKAASRCRALFWETYSTETIYALSVGRPTGTFFSNISCPFPPEEDLGHEPFVDYFPKYRQARWGWTRDVGAPIMENFLTVAKPSYETVLDLDSKFRRYLLTTPFESFVHPDDGTPQPPSKWIQQHLFPHLTNIMVMYIHSGSFLEAIRDNPDNPLQSSYATSFLAGYRSASEIIKANIKNFSTHPALFTRWWGIWKSLFNAGIIVGNIAAKYPLSPAAPQAMVELLAAVDLIEKGAISSGRARGGLAILQRLRDKAIVAYTHKTGHQLTPSPPTPITSKIEDEDTMNIFAGYTRVVANKVLARGMEPRLTPSATPPLQTGLFAAADGYFLSDGSSSNNNDRGKLNQSVGSDGFDPAVVEYFNTQLEPLSLYGDLAPLPQLPQNDMPFDDAGFFFTVPPHISAVDPWPGGGGFGSESASGSGAGAGWQTPPEMQWAQFLQSL